MNEMCGNDLEQMNGKIPFDAAKAGDEAGMILYLQNMGNLSTYSSHSQIGMFCIAALLVGMTCCAAKAVFGSCAEVGVQQTVRNLEDFFLWLRDVWTLAREKLELCAVIR